MILLIASIAPVLFFLFIIYIKDKNKEPFSMLAKCFFGGFLALIITLLIVIPISNFQFLFSTPFITAFWDAFFEAAIPEELSKFLILYRIVWKSSYFDEKYDGIIYAVFVSLGFAMIENILYVFQHGLNNAYTRAILAVPAHGFFGVSMGYFFTKAKFSFNENRNRNIVFCIFVPIVLHGIYDFILMYDNISTGQNWLFIFLLLIAFTIFNIYLWRTGIKKIKLLIKEDK